MTEEYLSCEWIESGLAFSPRNLHVCCMCHHGNKGWIEIADFQGGPLPVNAIRSVRQRIREENRSNGFEACQGCSLLQKKIWAPREYLINTINLSHFTICNLSCQYCYLQSSRTGEAWWNDDVRIKAGNTPIDLFPTFSSMVEENLMAPDTTINWGGGEPTLIPSFDELLSFLNSQKFNNYIATNGTLFNKEIFNGLSGGTVSLVCSVDAGTAETFRNLKKKDLFDRVWENLAEYAASGGSVSAKYIFVDQNSNEKDIIGFIEHAKKANIKEVICDVDAFLSTQSEQVRSGMTLMREIAEKNGIGTIVAGCGIAGFPEETASCVQTVPALMKQIENDTSHIQKLEEVIRNYQPLVDRCENDRRHILELEKIINNYQALMMTNDQKVSELHQEIKTLREQLAQSQEQNRKYWKQLDQLENQPVHRMAGKLKTIFKNRK